MWDLAALSLDTARLRGASYADARVMHLRQRDLTTKNGTVGTLAQLESIGIGIRVLANGAWGFASTDRLTRDGVAACAAQAVAIARASALAKRGDVVMAPEQAYVESWQAPFEKDPFEIPAEYPRCGFFLDPQFIQGRPLRSVNDAAPPWREK